MRSTEELEHEIRESDSPEGLSSPDFEAPEVTGYLNTLLEARGLTAGEAVRRCNLDRGYGYQMLNGTRRPTREFLILLSLALELGEAEAQRLLKLAGRPPLYARNRRDAAVLYGLSHGLGLEAADELLGELGEERLL